MLFGLKPADPSTVVGAIVLLAGWPQRHEIDAISASSIGP
jgi:hypothetical protein